MAKAQATEPTAEGEQPTLKKAWFRQFVADIVKNTSGIVVGFILAGASAGALLAWNTLNAFVDNRVTQIVTEALSRPDSTLSEHIETFVITRVTTSEARLHQAMTQLLDDSIKHSFDATVGALSAGRVLLTASAPAQSIYIYAPDGHKAQLLLRVKNLNTGDRVLVMAQDGLPKKLQQEGLYRSELSALVAAPANDAAIADLLTITPDDGEFQHLRAVRLQLDTATAAPTSGLETAAPTEVEYMAFVTPAIRMAGS